MPNLNIRSTDHSSIFYVRGRNNNLYKWDSFWVPPSSFSFATVTEDKLEEALRVHYNGDINLADYFSVGDVHTASNSNPLFQVASHTINIDYYNGSYTVNSGTVPKQTGIKWVIIGLSHDDLVNKIHSTSKAAITIQTLGMIGNSASASLEICMNSSNTNSGGWSACALRTYCKGDFYKACGFKNLIKLVSKPTCNTYNSSTISKPGDSIFLLSFNEVYGNSSDTGIPKGTEGAQYSYFPTNTYNTTYTVKHQGSGGLGSASDWWLRSCYSEDSRYFIGVSSTGNWSLCSGSTYTGVAPAACL